MGEESQHSKWQNGKQSATGKGGENKVQGGSDGVNPECPDSAVLKAGQ